MAVVDYSPPMLRPLPSAPILLIGALLLYRIGIIIYRLYFHPLARIPGPKTYAASYFPYLWQDSIRGTFIKSTLELHQKYGPVVRIAPNRVAFAGSIGWPEIFQRRADRAEFSKWPDFFGQQRPLGLLVAPRDDHRRQRRLLSHAFSTTALQEQEDYVTCYVDLLIQRLHENVRSGDPVVDICKWLNYTTFDIIGELAFADPFGCLYKSDYHPWVAMLFNGVFKAKGLKLFIAQYPLLLPFFLPFLSWKLLRDMRDNNDLAEKKTLRRIEMGESNRKDIMAYILKNNSDGKLMTHSEVLENSRQLIIAGSETTATALSGFSFFIPQFPDAYKKLTEEIRASFSSDDKVNMKSAAQLPYLNAVIEETLRLYPPATEASPRVSPGDTIGGYYLPPGTLATIFPWAEYRNENNFADALSFVPERWLPDSHPFYNPRYSNDNKAIFKPFSAGPRDCIGKNLAYSEMRLIICRLLLNFDIELTEGQEDWAKLQKVFTVYDKGPLMVRLKPVQRSQ